MVGILSKLRLTTGIREPTMVSLFHKPILSEMWY